MFYHHQQKQQASPAAYGITQKYALLLTYYKAVQARDPGPPHTHISVNAFILFYTGKQNDECLDPVEPKRVALFPSTPIRLVVHRNHAQATIAKRISSSFTIEKEREKEKKKSKHR